MLRGSYSLDGVGRPCCPCARQPSYSSPRSFPRPRRCRTVPPCPPCQATTGKTHGHHRAVRWRPDGSQNTSPRSRRPIDNNPDPRPFIKFSEDPASASPLSSLTLALARELERGNRGAAVAYDHGACPVARSASNYVCSLPVRLRASYLHSTVHTVGLPGQRSCLRGPGGRRAIDADDEAQGPGMRSAPRSGGAATLAMHEWYLRVVLPRLQSTAAAGQMSLTFWAGDRSVLDRLQATKRRVGTGS